MRKIRVLDLGARKGGILRRPIIEDMGFVYHTLDIDPQFKPDILADVREWEPDIEYDFIWASPPCEKFSVASIGKYWNKDHTPKRPEAQDAINLVQEFKRICLTAKYYAIENPRGKLRKLPVFADIPRYTVTYCQYGDSRMKPTDIWTNLHWTPRPMCKNGDSCHISAPRGSRTGTQGMKYSDSSIVPTELWVELLTCLTVGLN